MFHVYSLDVRTGMSLAFLRFCTRHIIFCLRQAAGEAAVTSLRQRRDCTVSSLAVITAYTGRADLCVGQNHCRCPSCGGVNPVD